MRFRKVLLVSAFGIFMSVSSNTSAVAETVAFFTFDNISGNSFTDVTGRGLVGTLGFSPEEGAPLIVPGPSGQEGDLAAEILVGEGLIVSDMFFDLLYIPPMTFEVWVKSTGFSTAEGTASYPILAYTGSYQLGVNSEMNIYYNHGGVNIDTGVPFPFDGEWHHLAVVVDDMVPIIEIYLDGEVIASVNQAPVDTSSPTTALLMIGRSGLTPNFLAFEGAVDRIRISMDPLSVDELDSDAATPKGAVASTIAYFDFDEGALPYMSEGRADDLEIVSLKAYTQGNAGAPQIVTDTPSGQDGDFALYFENQAFATVRDPNRFLDVGGAGNDWTLEAWVKYENLTAGRMVMLYYGPGAFSFSLSGGNPRLAFVTTLRIADFSSNSAAVFPGEWTHVAVAHRYGESLSFFVNGELIEERNYTGGSNRTEVTTMFIGSEPNGILPFTGWLDRIRISNVALTADELDSGPQMPTGVTEWSVYCVY